MNRSVRSCLIAVSVLLTLGGAARAESAAWQTDFDAAGKLAKESGKDLLVNFSGSDWCGWCIKLDEEVFSHQEFLDGVAEDFVLVLLDFPRQKENVEKIPEAQRKRNDELQTKYAIRGFPTVLLTDAEGTVFARTGYQAGGPEAYVKALAEFRTARDNRAKLMARINDVKGLDKAELLDELVENTAPDMQGDLVEQMKEIVALDADGQAGLRGKYELKVGMMDAMGQLQSQEYDKAIGTFQAMLKELDPQGEARQDLLFAMGEPYFHLEKTDKVVEVLEEALAAAPDSERAAGIKQMIERFSKASAE